MAFDFIFTDVFECFGKEVLRRENVCVFPFWMICAIWPIERAADCGERIRHLPSALF